MENYLSRKGLFSPEFRQQVLGDFGKQLEAAISATSK
jgi:hypothetical protein